MTDSSLAFASASALDSSSTSAFGSLGASIPPSFVITVSGALPLSATSAAHQTDKRDLYQRTPQPTASGHSLPAPAVPPTTAPHETTRRAISELRRISGLTWEQLAALFGVSRRSLHFWASGKAMSAANVQHLMQALDVVRNADRGDARSNRAALLECTNGTTPFDLIHAQRFDDALRLVGPGQRRPQATRTPLDPAALAARMPLPPADLVDAKQDRVHVDVGHGRAATTAGGAKRREPDR